jgi:hypothetical protein
MKNTVNISIRRLLIIPIGLAVFFLVGCGETGSPEVKEYLSKIEAIVIEVEQFAAKKEYEGSSSELSSIRLGYSQQGLLVANCGSEELAEMFTPAQNLEHLELYARFSKALAECSSIKAKE